MPPTITTWQDFVRHNVDRRDAPYITTMPIVYLGPLFLAIVAATTKTGMLREMFHADPAIAYAIALVVVLASLATMIFAARASIRNACAEALRDVTIDVAWFATIVGDRRTLEVLQASDPHSGLHHGTFETIADWHRFEAHIDSDLLAATLKGAVESENLNLIHSIHALCFPRTTHGWTTDVDKLDVQADVLRTLCAHKTFTATALRAQTRRQLYQAV
jgi:hypothetical protein